MQHAKQRPLGARRQALDLVQENGAPMRLGEQPGPRRMRIGKGAALVPEQLVFEQRVGQRRAIDGDERESAPGTEVVKRTGRELLAGSGFTRNEDRGLGFGKPAELVPYLNEGLRLAYQLVQHLRPSPAQQGIVGPDGWVIFRHGVLRADTRRTSDQNSSTRGAGIVSELRRRCHLLSRARAGRVVGRQVAEHERHAGGVVLGQRLDRVGLRIAAAGRQ